MPTRRVSIESLGRQVAGRQVVRAVADGTQRLTLYFSDGFSLVMEAASGELLATVGYPEVSGADGIDGRPTKRQFEYLAFIAKYIARFGRAPAEADIERHFLVSAPSVNQMMQTLERRGFIARQRGIPRSVRICIQLPNKGTLDR